MIWSVATPWFACCWKKHWCSFHWLNEAGLLTVQIGPVLLEIPTW
jgi:hypothetical protein